MINLARRDIAHHLKSYLLTGLGLGLLIVVTLTMAGVYRGMVDDAKVLLRAVDADVWVVQQDTLGPFAEPSSVPDDLYRALVGLPGVVQAGNVAYLTMQVSHAGQSQRVMVAGFEPGKPGGPAFLVAGRPIARAHYEAVADAKTGLRVGDVVRIRRNDYTVVGLTRRMVSSNGDPMLFIPLKDAQEAQFLKDNDAIVEDRRRLAANPAINRPGQPGVLDAVQAIQTSSHKVNAVLLRLRHGADARAVAATIARWQRFTAYTRAAMEEIAVLKLIGTRNRSIAAMIMQEALGLGVIGFFVGKFAATLWAPAFPKYVLLETGDAGRAFVLTLVVCALASVLAIRAALKIDPAEAIGG